MRRRLDMPFGAETGPDGVRFALWSPTVADVTLVLDGADHPMPPADAAGWRRLRVADARAGSRYAFRLPGGLVVPDPASRCQPDGAMGPSLVVDPQTYDWQDAGWTGRPWEEAVIYELHVGTFTPEGTYAALAARLPELRDLGVTAIELMPLADFVGARNWGYDGVLQFAPESAYGAPEDLKHLIDRAHALGVMMFLDVVYNHFGPAGNFLYAYAGRFFTGRHPTPWGAGINFDGADACPVRDFFISNALYWLTEFHFDGLRFDAVNAIHDDSEPHILTEIARAVRQRCAGRHVHLMLENDANQARWLNRDAGGAPRLYTAQWDDDLHHAWHVALTGERDGYYRDYAPDAVEHIGRALAEGFAYQGEPSAHRGAELRGESSAHLPPTAFVSFLQNHDQIGNRARGERLSQLASPERLALARAALLLSPQVPMLFMGEEWAASTPFLFFVDFSVDSDLSAAVREGRRKEFSGFASFTGQALVPDPTAADSFERSKLRWDERTRGPHAAVLADTRALIALREAEIVPLLKGRYLGAMRSRPAAGVLDLTWRFAAGALRFVANVGEEVPATASGGDARPLWQSPSVRFERGVASLPAWSGILLKEDGR